MSSRMRYGPRFGSTTVETRYVHDQRIADDLREIAARNKAIWNAMPQYKKELRVHEHRQIMRKRHPTDNARYEAEQRMAEAVRKVVEILEFHMSDMMEQRLVSGRPKLVNQLAIHDVIYALRTKCGVSFERNAQYDHKIRNGEKVRQPDDFDEPDPMTEQRRAREEKMRRIADRLIARPKSTD